MTQTATPGEAGVDYETVDFLVDTSTVQNPYPYYEFLRDKGPVWIEPHYGVAMVTGHAEALEVYRNSEIFSSCNAAAGPFPGLPTQPEGDDASVLIEAHRAEMPLAGYMATWDAPEHTAYRSLLQGLFTPRRLKENEDYIWRVVDQQLDEFIGSGRCEFISAFSSPFTALVIADLLGVPEEDRARFRAWFDSRSRPRGEAGAGADTEYLNELNFFESTFAGYISERREQPRDDVLTHLAQASFPDGSIPAINLLANEASFLFAAGQETTARTLAFVVHRLAENPAEQQALRGDRDGVSAYIEEMIRLESPVKCHFRMARKTTTLGGVRIPAGTSVGLLLGAINRDPARFDAPAQLRLDRGNVFDHLAFIRGPHTCLGQQLARLESRIALGRILDRMTDIRISDERHGPAGARRFSYDPTSLFRGLQELHIEFTPTPTGQSAAG